jgi:hypothetical protein
MPRKKKETIAENTGVENTGVENASAANNSAVATAQVEPLRAEPKMDYDTEAGPGEQPKNWGPPYKAIYTNAEKGFELGENRRFKQRVFTFKDKPEQATIDALKAAGFKYRAEEKAWTVQASPVTRELSDQLALQFAGVEAMSAGRGR